MALANLKKKKKKEGVEGHRWEERWERVWNGIRKLSNNKIEQQGNKIDYLQGKRILP